MAGKWCQDCRAFMVDGATCPECRRRKAWGTVNRAIRRLAIYEGPAEQEVTLAALEAISLLMQERQALLHQHRRDMMEEQRAASRGAGEAYDSGRDDGRREGRGDW